METKQELLEFAQWINETPRLYQEHGGWSWFDIELTDEQLVDMYMKHKNLI
jgi:hypothetical protein